MHGITPRHPEIRHSGKKKKEARVSKLYLYTVSFWNNSRMHQGCEMVGCERGQASQITDHSGDHPVKFTAQVRGFDF